MTKQNGRYSIMALLGLAVISKTFFHDLSNPNATAKKRVESQENKCSSRTLASIKNMKINNEVLKKHNDRLEKIDLIISSKINTDINLKELKENLEEVNAIKKEVESFKKTLLENNLGLASSIRTLEGQINFKIDKDKTKNLTTKPEELSEEKKKELQDKLASIIKNKELLKINLTESDLVLENIENLTLTVNDSIKKLENLLKKPIENKVSENQKEEKQISTLEEQLCTKEQKIKELELEIKELIKDKEEVAQVINRKKIKLKEESEDEIKKQDEKILEKIHSLKNGDFNNNNQGNMQMLLQQNSLMMQAMQMQQMRSNMQPLYLSNPFQQDQQKFLYGSQLLAEMQLAQQLGRGISPNGLNNFATNLYGTPTPITNNYYFTHDYQPFSNPFNSFYGTSMPPMTMGGQSTPFGANPFSYNYFNSPFVSPVFPRGQVGGGAFFNFGQTPNKI